MSFTHFTDYVALEKLHDGKVQVYRCRHISSGLPVIIKSLPLAGEDTQEHARLRYEFDILTRLAQPQSAVIPRALELIESQGHLGLVMTDIGGYALNKCVAQAPLSVEEVLLVGHALASALVWAHQTRIIHKDVSPTNIIYNRETRQVQLIDFSIATLIPREFQATQDWKNIEGTLPYISPEQTGRMNRALDYRSDFYSLGVTLYELCCGRVPFKHDHLPEFVHATLTQVPPLVSELTASVPQMLALVIAKLLQKEPEQRYQSAHGICQDLAACLTDLQATGHVLAFALAQHDRIERFELPQKIYGRDKELEQLNDCFAKVRTGQRALTLISGASGVGKSALVSTLQQEWVKARAFFAYAKFDQLREALPFSAFGQAIGRLVQRILMEDATRVAAWQTRLQIALGDSGQALVDIAPNLELLLGRQAPLPTLPAEEHADRLLLLMQRFVRALSAENPLVLVFEDLQWSDAATLRLLESICVDTQPCAGLWVLSTYRHHDTHPHDALLHTLNNIQMAGVAVLRLELSPMTRADVTELVTDTLGNPGAADLAELVHRKTAGNAFFVGEFLRYLWTHEQINYDVQAGRWTWNMDALSALKVTDNVGDFLTQALGRLPDETGHMLSLGACLGDQFTLRVMSGCSHKDSATVAQILRPAVVSGLLAVLGHDYRGEPQDPDRVLYQFAHDRVRQASYEFASSDMRRQFNYDAGRFGLANTEGRPTSEWIFAVVDHLNEARAIIAAAEERKELAGLNLTAGIEARKAAAYERASAYLQVAATLVAELDGQRGGALEREIQLELADSEYLSGNSGDAVKRLKDLTSRTKDVQDVGQVEARRVQVLYAAGKHREAIDCAIAGAHQLGIDIPAKPSRLYLTWLCTQVLVSLRRRDLAKFATTAQLADPRIQAGLDVLEELPLLAFLAGDIKLYIAASMLMMRVLMRHGNAPQSPAIFTYTATIFGLSGEEQMALNLRQLAQKMMSMPYATRPTAALLGEASCVTHLHERYDTAFEFCARACQMGLEVGDFVNVASLAQVAVLYQTSRSLLDAGRFIDMILQSVAHVDPINTHMLRTSRQMLRCLRGETTGPLALTDDSYDEAEHYGAMSQLLGPLATCHYSSLKLQIALINRDFTVALQMVDLAMRHRATMLMVHHTGAVAFAFCTVLTMTQRLLHSGDKLTRAQAAHLRIWSAHLRWLAAAGPNHHGLLMLYEAEQAALADDDRRAAGLYEEALERIEATGNRQFYALACEAAGRHHLRQGAPTAAHGYIAAAIVAYRTWGAIPKANTLQAEFVAAMDADEAAVVPRRRTLGTSARQLEKQLDLLAVLRASQAISSETVLSSLVQRLLTGVLTSAGADRGLLLLAEDGVLVVRAQEFTGRQAAKGPRSADGVAVPERVTQYVARTREPLLLDRDEPADFWSDPYFAKHQPSSALCAPILTHGKLVGVVYLENAVTAHAFSKQSLQVVEVLASQAAISIENARLISHLEEKVQERTSELEQAQSQLVRLEKEATEVQMAGGFAHEMRNALSAARTMLDKAFGVGRPGEQSMSDETGVELTAIYDIALRALPKDELPKFIEHLSRVVVNEESLNEVLTGVRSATNRALHITQQILEYARLGEMVPGDELVDLGSVVKSVLVDLSAKIGAARAETYVNLPLDLRLHLKEAHLYSLLNNLVINARDALLESSRTPRVIVVYARQVDKRIEIGVEDNGPGIPDNVRARLFTPFVTTKGSNGTGLGLGIVKKLVELYGGTIDVFTDPAEGTRFIVNFPGELVAPPR